MEQTQGARAPSGAPDSQLERDNIYARFEDTDAPLGGGLKIGGIHYRPFEMLYDRGAEGRAAWGERIRWALLKGEAKENERREEIRAQLLAQRQAVPLESRAAPSEVSSTSEPPPVEDEAHSALMARVCRQIGF